MNRVCSVSEVTAAIKDRLDDMPRYMVEGEVANLRPPNTSGHLYFSLSDETAKLSAAFFAHWQRRQPDLPPFQNGDKVRVTGKLSLYPPSGSYHLIVEHLERADGAGELKARFDALKKKLFAEGLCEPSRKRSLPLLPKRIGIVTAPSGAAIRDILNILNRRFPNLHIILSPCRVQGTEAVEEIATAIERLNRHFGPESDEPLDAMIVGRGGGSLEDLWCFNEERVARAVAASRIPTISAVGHEPDIAITDFVADLRAPTPSAAAELICGCKEDLEKRLHQSKDRLLIAMRTSYANARTRIRYYESSALFRDPMHTLELRSQKIDLLEHRLSNVCQRCLAHHQQKLTDLAMRFESIGMQHFSGTHRKLDLILTQMAHLVTRTLDRAQSELREKASKLQAYNPFNVLKRGYALTTNAKGEVITEASQAAPGEALSIRLHHGRIEASVTKTSETT